MSQPLVSVIIPAYNNAEYLGDAIQSVLNQTYSNFELIVVNDASPDHTDEVMKSFKDHRIKYIVHEKNQGLSAARNSGIRASTGDYIALLDGDDFFHPEKLRSHVEFLEERPEIGVTYNARFELNHSAKTIRAIWRPPLTVGLGELVSGFPFGPSDMVLRREWAFKVDLFDEYYVYVGEDLDFNCRLALAGCKFASVDRALNYRRYHSGRVIGDIPYFVNSTFRAMKAALQDPRCPDDVLLSENEAFAGHYILWSAIAFIQNDIELGQDYCRAAVRLNPFILDGRPPKVVEIFINYSILDDRKNHEELLRRLFRHLPDELQPMTKQGEDWAVARGFLLKGIRAIMWERLDEGKEYFAQAIARGAKISSPLSTEISVQLVNYEKEFGPEATHRVIQNLLPFLNKIENPTGARWSKGLHLLNQAFMSFIMGQYTKVPSYVVQAMVLEPTYLGNRGVLRIMLLSLLRKLSGQSFQ